MMLGFWWGRASLVTNRANSASMTETTNQSLADSWIQEEILSWMICACLPASKIWQTATSMHVFAALPLSMVGGTGLTFRSEADGSFPQSFQEKTPRNGSASIGRSREEVSKTITPPRARPNTI